MDLKNGVRTFLAHQIHLNFTDFHESEYEISKTHERCTLLKNGFHFFSENHKEIIDFHEK